MPAPEQIFCWFFAIFLLVAALRCLVKEKLSWSFVLCLCAIGFAFFGLSGVQGLLKTGLLITVKDSLVKYGEKLESFQTNVISMRAELADQQSRIRTAQTNMATQQEALSDVTYWVRNLYANITNETISVSDTNRVIVSQLTNVGFCVCVTLDHVPIRNSIQGSILCPDVLYIPQSLPQPTLTYGNLFFTGLPKLKDVHKAQLRIQYVKDTRRTNVTDKLELRGNDYVLGGNWLAHFDTNGIFLVREGFPPIPAN
jgi:hypothetical protein